jgi:hypothetical protein
MLVLLEPVEDKIIETQEEGEAIVVGGNLGSVRLLYLTRKCEYLMTLSPDAARQMASALQEAADAMQLHRELFPRAKDSAPPTVQ